MYSNIKGQSSTVVKLKLLLPQPNTLNSACDIFSFKWQADENFKKTRPEVELVFPRKASACYNSLGFPSSWDGKESASNAGDLGWKMPWRRAWQPTPVFLHGESPWTEEPGGLQSMGLQRVRHNRTTKHTAYTHVIPTSKPQTYSAF